MKNRWEFKSVGIFCSLFLFAVWVPMNVFSLEVMSHKSNVISQSENVRQIWGIVWDGETEKPIANVWILIEGLKTGTLTNSDGQFALLVTPGMRVQVLSENYQSASFSVNEEMTSAFVKMEKISRVSERSSVECVREEAAEYPGGFSACMAFVAANLQYPKAAALEGIQGKVLVKFVIDSDGSIMDVHVANRVDPFLDAEALRVVKLMPKWKPATRNGKPIPTRATIPVTFKLTN